MHYTSVVCQVYKVGNGIRDDQVLKLASKAAIKFSQNYS